MTGYDSPSTAKNQATEPQETTMENDTFRRYLALLILDDHLLQRHRKDPEGTMKAAGLSKEQIEWVVVEDSISDLLSHLDPGERPFPPDEPPDTGD